MTAELLLLQKEEWEQLQRECRWTKAEAEAHMIAGKIRYLFREGKVTEDGQLRPVRPGDIAILLRTMSGWRAAGRRNSGKRPVKGRIFSDHGSGDPVGLSAGT